VSAPVNDGGPAHPTYESNGEGHIYCTGGGMSVRDEFASRAMQGAQANVGANKWTVAQTAEHAYRIADAMLIARLA
jgi:hypothetical protein